MMVCHSDPKSKPSVMRRAPVMILFALTVAIVPGVNDAFAQRLAPPAGGGGGGFRSPGGGGGVGGGILGGILGGIQLIPGGPLDARPAGAPSQPPGRPPGRPGGVAVDDPGAGPTRPPSRKPPKIAGEDQVNAPRVSGKKPPPSQRVTQPPPANAAALLPPPGENRFAPDLILAIIRDDVSEQQINALLTANGLARTNNGGERVALINARLYRFRITDRRPVATVLAALGRDPRVLTTQPDYRFTLGQSATAAPSIGGAAAASFGALQYSARKLQLEQAHQVGRGDQVRVAIIDSLIDAAHPELAGGIGKQIDVLDGKDATAHAHGTAMAGAIIARSRLTGVAPAAKVIGIRAFSVSASGATAGSTFDLVRALDRAVGEGAQVINLSFAGPKDPLLQRAIGAAAGKGSVMIAAAGNAGPISPPLFPAADPNVIAVTATDSDDKVFAGANRGSHIAVAAPGVDVIVPGPGGAYEMTTGTSIAAAHVSGLAALLIGQRADLGTDGIRKLLQKSAHDLGPPGADSDTGAGLADAKRALAAMDGLPVTAVTAAEPAR